MNRHIYGLTVFLVIVKTHFLLYWLFFAPVNFISTQEVINLEVSPLKVEESKSCKKARAVKADLRFVEIDVKRGVVSASIDFPKLEQISDLSFKSYRMHIFTQDLRSVWIGDVKPAFIEDNLPVTFKGSSPEFKKLSRKVNYYAQIDILPYSESPKSEYAVYGIQQATPILLVFDDKW